MDHEATANKAQTAMKANYGHGAEALPWAQIFAMFMQFIQSCTNPTPASITANLQGFFGKIGFMRKVAHPLGIFGNSAEKLYTTSVTTLTAATEEEKTAFIEAAQA